MFMGNGRAKANFSADGFVKIIADKDSDRILEHTSSAQQLEISFTSYA